MRFYRFIFATISLGLLAGCDPKSGEGKADFEFPDWDGQTLFEAVPTAESGVAFANELRFDPDFNIYTYRNYYNGGGVALGDVNNDGLTDLYFSGNQVANELYLNRGDLQFEPAGAAAGVAGTGGWSTGVSMADVNGDGWLDIYVCNSGELDGDNKQNELFINNQDGTFTEAATDWGIADRGYGTHGVFFDYDRDGDLDLYLLNNSYQAIGSFNLRKNERPKRDPVGGDKLFRNDLINADGPSRPGFTDVSVEAGMYGSVIGFGLGVTVGDVDRDGWQDIYVSNDFFERDYLYINQTDGTFQEVLTDRMQSISAASMGADLADINNDGYGDIFVTEMLPETNARIKTATTFENWNRYQYNVQNDYYHQFTRNVLQRNNGDGTFSEVGRLSGVEASDWSWGALIFDMDNDGNKDLFVANGIYQDLTNRDFLDFIAADETKKAIITRNGVDFKALVDAIPSNPVPNYAFRNQGPAGEYRFEKVSAAYGLDLAWFTNGSAYGDLDNDGDLDLVINNTNGPALVYRNHARAQNDRSYLQLRLSGRAPNTAALGSQVTVHTPAGSQYLEAMPMRGFESTVDGKLHFGLGAATMVDSLVIIWPDGGRQVVIQPEINQLLALTQPEGTGLASARPTVARGLRPQEAAAYGIDFVHQENRYSDFDVDPLLYHMRSAEGPALCSGDFNGDGAADFYIGGAKGQPGALYLNAGERFRRVEVPVFTQDANAEDVDCACFDADGDGDADLYVASGGSEFGATNTSLLDRLYRNEGGGSNWVRTNQTLPNSRRPVISSSVAVNDVDADGDLDVFVGGRMLAGAYGEPSDSYLLLNDGAGNFTSQPQAALDKLGLVTDAAWADLDADGRAELVIVGEWMVPKIFSYANGTLHPYTDIDPPHDISGWYNRILVADLDGNEFPDLVLGNHGLNSRFRASAAEPILLHYADFDGNGRKEPVISTVEDGVHYPMPLLHDLNKQMPGLRKRYLKYAGFGEQTTEDIFGTEALDNATTYRVTELRSLVLLNDGKTLTARPLPLAAQEAPLYALAATDVDGDGDQDLLTGGNFYYAKPEVGRYDADRGDILYNDGSGTFTPGPNLGVRGEPRAFAVLPFRSGSVVLAGRNNDTPLVYRLNSQ